MENDKNETGTERASEEANLTILAIPEDKAQAVLEFVASLKSGEDDVSGHMISWGRTPISDPTGTNCLQTTTENLGTDLKCSDSDKGSAFTL